MAAMAVPRHLVSTVQASQRYGTYSGCLLAANVLDRLFGRRGLRHGFLSHLRFLRMSYDEPKILSSQLSHFCLKGADVGQRMATYLSSRFARARW